MNNYDFDNIHKSWKPLIKNSLAAMDESYLEQLYKDRQWLPGKKALLNAFSLPLSEVQYILFGESPYPRPQSANGYAFWDAAVTNLWSEKGLSVAVNRATSLRNFIKMLLIAEKRITLEDLSQTTIANLDKTHLVQTATELFLNFQRHGIMLLNASLVLSTNPVRYDAKHWQVFLATLLQQLLPYTKNIKLILLGKVAYAIKAIPAAQNFVTIEAEHPYNLSFINNKKMHNLFAPVNLLDLLHNLE